MTIDEELMHLDDSVRKLKLDYDVYFGGGSKRPPTEAEWRVQTAFKRMGDNSKLNFSQRFKFNGIQQKYALYNSLWQQKLRIKEEGYRRPQDALHGIAGLRVDERIAAEEAINRNPTEGSHEQRHAFRAAITDATADTDTVQRLYNVMMAAQSKVGAQAKGSFESFQSFVQKKTQQVRSEYGCHAVEYSVEMENGQVRLKAKAKV